MKKSMQLDIFKIDMYPVFCIHKKLTVFYNATSECDRVLLVIDVFLQNDYISHFKETGRDKLDMSQCVKVFLFLIIVVCGTITPLVPLWFLFD